MRAKRPSTTTLCHAAMVCTLIGLMGTAAARADIAGIGDGTGFTFSGSAAPTVTDELSLANGSDQSGNVFFNAKQDISGFFLEFDYRIANSSSSPTVKSFDCSNCSRADGRSSDKVSGKVEVERVEQINGGA